MLYLRFTKRVIKMVHIFLLRGSAQKRQASGGLNVGLYLNKW